LQVHRKILSTAKPGGKKPKSAADFEPFRPWSIGATQAFFNPSAAKRNRTDLFQRNTHGLQGVLRESV
jgi:hypothetical protein